MSTLPPSTLRASVTALTSRLPISMGHIILKVFVLYYLFTKMTISLNPLFLKNKIIPAIKDNSRKEDSQVLTWEVRECIYISWFTWKECINDMKRVNHGVQTLSQCECLVVKVGLSQVFSTAQPHLFYFLSLPTLHSCASQLTYSSTVYRCVCESWMCSCKDFI